MKHSIIFQSSKIYNFNVNINTKIALSFWSYFCVKLCEIEFYCCWGPEFSFHCIHSGILNMQILKPHRSGHSVLSSSLVRQWWNFLQNIENRCESYMMLMPFNSHKRSFASKHITNRVCYYSMCGRLRCTMVLRSWKLFFFK